MLGVPSVNHVLCLCPLQAVAVRKQEKQLPPVWHSLPGMLREAVVSAQVQVLLLWFLHFISSSDSQVQLSLFFPPFPSQLAPHIQS